MTRTLILLLAIFTFIGCSKDDFITDGSAQLTFSTDTVIFDTVFTQIGSATYNVKVYNPHPEPIKISSITLAGGEASNFRINIDGTPTTKATDIELAALDSIYIFAEVTVDPNSLTGPIVITDSLVFETNGNTQDVDLVAWGIDADFYVYSSFGGGNTYTLSTERPSVFYGYSIIQESSTLIVQEGTEMYFHKFSGIYVGDESTININGSQEAPVLLQGDRLEYAYDDVAGQWGHPYYGGIHLGATSKNNTIDFAVIKNGNIGLAVDSFNIASGNPSLVIRNTKIENMSGVGLLARGAKIEGANVLINNCGTHTLALAYGGSYTFNHCTFANYWKHASRSKGQILINNYYEDADKNIVMRDLERARFHNCIIYGNNDEELEIDTRTGASFSYNFLNCLIRTKLTGLSRMTDVTFNPANVTVDGETHDPVFNDPQAFDFELFEQSVARDIGNTSLTDTLVIDINGADRSATPDLGCYEFL